jgi:peptidoglycan hydrolase-like protein with peptidoglycan-binding domain
MGGRLTWYFDLEVANMTFKWLRLLPIAAAIALFPASSFAQNMCDTSSLQEEQAVIDTLPPSCIKERLQASGGVSAGILVSAERKANNEWRHQAVTKYGERYGEVAFMACRKVFCVKGSVIGTKRCTISGFPCAADMNATDKAQVQRVQSTAVMAELPKDRAEAAEDLRSGYGGYNRPLEDVELGEQEITRMQQLLGVEADGQVGPMTERALRDFRRSVGLPVGGPPTQQDLEKLAHAEKRSWGR